MTTSLTAQTPGRIGPFACPTPEAGGRRANRSGSVVTRTGAGARPRLWIALFGNLQLTFDGAPLRFAVRPMVPLLAYLALTAQRATPSR